MKNFYLMKIKNRIWNFIEEEDGIGTVEMILILVEKRVTGNTYVLCGN